MQKCEFFAGKRGEVAALGERGAGSGKLSEVIGGGKLAFFLCVEVVDTDYFYLVAERAH